MKTNRFMEQSAMADELLKVMRDEVDAELRAEGYVKTVVVGDSVVYKKNPKVNVWLERDATQPPYLDWIVAVGSTDQAATCAALKACPVYGAHPVREWWGREHLVGVCVREYHTFPNPIDRGVKELEAAGYVPTIVERPA